MIFRVTFVLLVLAGAAHASLFDLMPSPLGDARYGRLEACSMTNGRFAGLVTLPTGDHPGITVTAWARVVTSNDTKGLTTGAFWCPDRLVLSNPDLLGGAGGYWREDGTNLTAAGGAITVADFPWQPYTEPHLTVASNKWPRGVYTIAGWASNAVTVTLGGADVVVGPGAFNVNALPGVAAGVVLSGSGQCRIGISRCPAGRFFDEIDGLMDGMKINAGLITNEIAFAVWRFYAEGSNQVYRSDIGDIVSPTALATIAHTNAGPVTGKFSSEGHYRIRLIWSTQTAEIDWFDSRVFPWSLSDDELDRVHRNGVDEINRRGIPRWK